MATGTHPRPRVESRDDTSTWLAGTARDRVLTAGALPAATAGAVIAAAVAAAVIALATRTTYVARVRWRWLLAGSMLAALAWALSLALIDGPSGLLASLGGRYDYLAAVADAGSPDGFLARFLPGHDSWPIHVQGHPPGMVLFLLGLDAVGLARTGVVAALVLVGGSAAVPAGVGAAPGAGRAPPAGPPGPGPGGGP